MSNCKLHLAPCSQSAMVAALSRWYYRNEAPKGRLIRMGVWEDDRFIGVLVFNNGSTSRLGGPFGCSTFQASELCRIALDKHKTPTSRIIAIALQLVKKSNPGLRVCVTYCDPEAGHKGTVYEAMGWTYTGDTPKDKRYKDERGHEYHSRSLSVNGRKMRFGVMGRVPRPQDMKEVRIVPGKKRFAWPFDEPMRKLLSVKRAGSRDVAAPAFQDGEGGSIPTPALQ